MTETTLKKENLSGEKNICHLNWSPDVQNGLDLSLQTSHFVRQPTFENISITGGLILVCHK